MIKGQVYRVKRGVGKGGLGQRLSGKEFIAEGYWHELTGECVFESDLRNMAVLEFCQRVFDRIKDFDDRIPHEYEVIYGHIKEGNAWIGHLFFEGELKKVTKWI